MGEEKFGPAGEHIGRSSDWPKGVEDLLRQSSRVYWNWVNGNEHAYYKGDIDSINELLDLYGKIDLRTHQVIVVPGSPEAQSFQGLKVAYTVEFEIGGGIYLGHVQQYAKTGLYCTIPRLTVHVNKELAKQLDDLKVPENVTLLAHAYRPEDALAYVISQDSSHRYRALTLLGNAGKSTPEIDAALKQGTKAENESVRKAADLAIEKIAVATSDANRPLREQVASFLLRHPQGFRERTPEVVLAALRQVDDDYAKGFTVKGTTMRPTLSGWGQLISWTITMSDQRLVIDERPVVDDDHPRAEGQLGKTLFISPDKMGTLHHSRLWVDGELIDAKPHATFEPVGSTYDLLIGQVTWPTGRGYMRRIDRITSVTQRPDGMLNVKAQSDGNLRMRWDLVLDPHAGYLVRHAKAYFRDEQQPKYIVDTSGVFGTSERCTVHTARWQSGSNGAPLSKSITYVSATPDMDLIRRTEEALDSAKR